MGALDEDKLKKARSGSNSQTDPCINPDGMYSGQTKRLAVTDGKFVDIKNMPKDTRNKGRVYHTDAARKIDLSRGKFE